MRKQRTNSHKISGGFQLISKTKENIFIGFPHETKITYISIQKANVKHFLWRK